MPRRKIIREVVEGTVTIEHPRGDMFTMEKIVPVICPSCSKAFYKVAKRAKKGLKFDCAWCGVELENTHTRRYEVKLA